MKTGRIPEQINVNTLTRWKKCTMKWSWTCERQERKLGSEGTAPLIFDLATRWRGQLHAAAALPPAKNHR